MINNKIIILSSMYFEDNNYDIQDIKSTLIDGIELRVSDIIYNDNIKYIEKMEKMIKKDHINIFSIHAPFQKTDISSLDEYNRKKSIRDIEKAIIIANRLNAKYVVCHASAKFDNNNTEKRFNQLYKSLIELKQTAMFYNIEILIENVFGNRLINSIEHIRSIVNKKFNLCFDTGHALLSGIDFNAVFNKFNNNIKMIHLHYNNGINDSHSLISNKEKDILDFIKKFNNNVIINFEIMDKRDINEICKAIETLWQ